MRTSTLGPSKHVVGGAAAGPWLGATMVAVAETQQQTAAHSCPQPTSLPYTSILRGAFTGRAHSPATNRASWCVNIQWAVLQPGHTPACLPAAVGASAPRNRSSHVLGGGCAPSCLPCSGTRCVLCALHSRGGTHTHDQLHWGMALSTVRPQGTCTAADVHNQLPYIHTHHVSALRCPVPSVHGSPQPASTTCIVSLSKQCSTAQTQSSQGNPCSTNEAM